MGHRRPHRHIDHGRFIHFCVYAATLVVTCYVGRVALTNIHPHDTASPVVHWLFNDNETCAQQAALYKPSDEEVISALSHQSRQLPSIDAGTPVLAASNWEGIANAQHAESTRAQLTQACYGHVFRYRVVSRVIYTDHNHKRNDVLRGHRETFLEMLLVAVWLYKSFPDVDLWVSFADEPSRCTLDIPVLQYTVIGANVTQAAAWSNTVTDGSTFSVVQLLTGGGTDPPNPSAPAPKFYRGWAFNYPYSWENLSFLPSVLRFYQQCLLEKVAHKPSIPKVIWRGGNTGSRRGWAPLTAQPLQLPWGTALTNKRMALALLARSHSDWMDVGLHEILPELMGPDGQNKQLLKDLRQLVIRSYVPLETWGTYALQLSVDGHGSPNRLPMQYLQGSSVVLKMMSPYKDSFEELFKPGVHYEPFKYDLSDLVPRAQRLLERFKSGEDRSMLAMAARAAAQAHQVFNMLGQLDSLMYAILKVKSVCRWEVQQPPLRDQPSREPSSSLVPGVTTKPEWEVLKLERSGSGSRWRSPSLKAGWSADIRNSIRQELATNFA